MNTKKKACKISWKIYLIIYRISFTDQDLETWIRNYACQIDWFQIALIRGFLMNGRALEAEKVFSADDVMDEENNPGRTPTMRVDQLLSF